jgi:hypothetical protein
MAERYNAGYIHDQFATNSIYGGHEFVDADNYDKLEALLLELIDIEGPQPGHVMWYEKVTRALCICDPVGKGYPEQ